MAARGIKVLFHAAARACFSVHSGIRLDVRGVHARHDLSSYKFYTRELIFKAITKAFLSLFGGKELYQRKESYVATR